MKLAWAIGWCFMAACATTSGTDRTAQVSSSDEREVRCHLIGTINELNQFEPHAVVDETKTHGPSKVVWMHPPNRSIIKTAEGDVYRCDAAL